MNKNDLNNEHLDIDIYEGYSYDYLNDNQAIFSYCIESGYLVFTGHHILATGDGLNHQKSFDYREVSEEMKDEVTAYIKEHLDEFLKKPKFSECSYPIQYLFIQIENSQNGMYFVDDLDELENIFGITTDPIEEMKKLQDEIDALHLSHYIELHHPYRTEDPMITVYGGLEQAINRDELNAEMIIKDFMVDTDAIVSEMLPCELRNTQTSGSFLMINNIMDIISSKENIVLFLKYSEDSELTRHLNDFKNKWFEGDLSVEMIVPELNLNNQRTERR